MPKGVIFDMDGLMFDSERVYDRLWEPACKLHGVTYNPAANEASRGVAGVQLRRILQEYYPTVDPQEFLETLWRLYAEATVDGVPEKPGLQSLVAYLHSEGIPMAVASSTKNETVRKHLTQAGILDTFTAIVTGDMVARSKPNPDIFLEAARQLGLPAAECMVLEDSYNGVRAGAAAGCLTVMVPDIMQPDDEMRTLADAISPSLCAVEEAWRAGAYAGAHHKQS